ncbi:pre-mRNA processing ribonucleoprotein binding region-containing protein [Actinidia rufa]|uniref:Pre-mRNA processing ribonucleoprotein binding region-containing protein n=1 Tax=Actinidia rufa TaxID=165716 RepID=A0A7J0HDQ0_9ERIC|nr:pre-mRNA processing ribonucleoprotein binding region-containing protein [Actinidia rufa]
MTVPVMPRKVWNGELVALDDDDEEMLPLHEIVARGSAILPKTTFSVLQDVGRRLWFTLSACVILVLGWTLLTGEILAVGYTKILTYQPCARVQYTEFREHKAIKISALCPDMKLDALTNGGGGFVTEWEVYCGVRLVLTEYLCMLQATLADSFLADLDELSDNEADIPEEDNLDAENMEEDVDGDLADIETLNYDDLDSVSKLQKTQRYIDIMQKVEEALEKGSDMSNHGIVLEDDPEYQLIVDCNALSVDIENEIIIIHNFIRDKYRLKFPELESLVHHPIDYARVVKKIANEMDLTLVDLEGLLPSAIIMVVSVTASTTSGKPLPEDVLQKTVDACDRALALDSAKKMVLDFVESRMGYIAPNLSAIVGSAVAAKLMGTAGGLSALAKMPACNVQLLGAKKKNLAGFSTATSQFRVGYIEQTEVFQSTPPSLRMRACRLLAAKSTLAARVDSTRGDPTGKTGRNFREEIRKKIEKWQEPPPAKQPKPLPVPDSEPKKKRGGRRLRKMKERYAITDMRKLANRMQFGVPEESSLGDGLGEGYGMLGQAGSGKLRVSVAQSKLAAKVSKRFKEKPYGSSGATSGLTSSLAFTPVQGIELSNPQAANQLGSGTQSTYFSEIGTFSKIKRT